MMGSQSLGVKIMTRVALFVKGGWSRNKVRIRARSIRTDELQNLLVKQAAVRCCIHNNKNNDNNNKCSGYKNNSNNRNSNVGIHFTLYFFDGTYPCLRSGKPSPVSWFPCEEK